jgi:hypothetical protein
MGPYVVHGSLPAPRGSIWPGSRSRVANWRLRSDAIKTPLTFTSPTDFLEKSSGADVPSCHWWTPFAPKWFPLVGCPGAVRLTSVPPVSEVGFIPTETKQLISRDRHVCWKHVAPTRCGNRVALRDRDRHRATQVPPPPSGPLVSWTGQHQHVGPQGLILSGHLTVAPSEPLACACDRAGPGALHD